MRATIKGVSARAGVSTKTVSRVLNREKHVSADVQQRVEEAIEPLAFQPSAAARMLASKRSHQIALIYDNHSPHYIHQIQTGIWERGIALPGALSVAGFDDTALAGQLWPPRRAWPRAW